MLFKKNKKEDNKELNNKKQIVKNFNFSFLNNNLSKSNDSDDLDNAKTEIEKQKETKKNFNPFYGFMCFFVFLVSAYLIISILRTRFNNRIGVEIFEVQNGEIVNYSSETGFIFRDEEVFPANETGYINFMNLSNTRISKDSLLYIINDENKYNLDNVSFSDNDYKTISNTVKNYINNTNDLYFQNTYNYNKSINYILSELKMVDTLSSITDNTQIEVKAVGYAKKSGIISYYLDGYENRVENDFTSNYINLSDNVNVHDQSSYVKQGQNIFKIIYSPDYDILFSSKFDYSNFVNKNITVKFRYDDLYADAKLTEFYASDGKKYYKVTLNKYLERYLDRRIIEFEIINKSISGLKIPNTAIAVKNCYKIPKSYLFTNDNNEEVFHKLDNEGNPIDVASNISKTDADFYYVSIDDVDSNFNFGDILQDKDNNIYPLNNVVQLPGVYNVNKGYCIFKNIEILDQANEFSIISTNTGRGIALYDHIVLNANIVKDGDLIYQ